MPEFKKIDVAQMPYFYVERSASMDPADISRAMGEAFQAVWGFMSSHDVKPAGPALSVYYSYDPEKMHFRSGFAVAASDMDKAEGEVKADVTPAGRVLNFTHIGPYSTLREDYGAMMGYLQQQGLEMTAPTWEIYLNSPDEVPEAELRTDVFTALAA